MPSFVSAMGFPVNAGVRTSSIRRAVKDILELSRIPGISGFLPPALQRIDGISKALF